MSQNAKELYSRFSHLLQPIRDLTKNWDVDVASQLEEYIEEVVKLVIISDTLNCGAVFLRCRSNRSPFLLIVEQLR